jgi:uncharacterized protein (DUF2384 family)
MTVNVEISANSLLGGRAVLPRAPRSGLDWVEIVRHGISSQALDSMLRPIDLSQSELVQALDIPERTFAQRKREGVFSREESAKLLRLARIAARAADCSTISMWQLVGSRRRQRRLETPLRSVFSIGRWSR